MLACLLVCFLVCLLLRIPFPTSTGISEQHLGKPDLVKEACSVVWPLADEQDNRDVVREEGGIELILMSMLAHLGDLQLQTEVMKCIKNLATNTKNKLHFQHLGCETMIVMSVYAHPGEPDLYKLAFAALNNVVVDTATRLVAAVDQRTIELILNTMTEFRQEEELQASSLFLLKSLTYEQTTCARIDANNRLRERLLDNLRFAIDRFPGTPASKTANKVMQRLVGTV